MHSQPFKITDPSHPSLAEQVSPILFRELVPLGCCVCIPLESGQARACKTITRLLLLLSHANGPGLVWPLKSPNFPQICEISDELLWPPPKKDFCAAKICKEICKGDLLLLCWIKKYHGKKKNPINYGILQLACENQFCLSLPSISFMLFVLRFGTHTVCWLCYFLMRIF